MLSWGEEILRCHVETEEVPEEGVNHEFQALRRRG